MHPDIQEILFTESEIGQKVAELGRRLSEEYQEQDLVCVCILKGAIPFMADLIRKIALPLEIDTMAVSSYGNSSQSSGVVRIIKDLEASIENRHILVVEDIVDTGLTLNYLIGLLKGRNAASVKMVTLLDKPDRRQVELKPDYCGFQIPDVFVVGYGLDHAQKYRNLPYIGVLQQKVYLSSFALG
jgi:hypoxanthine phosphoribosyltransferase